jgi:molecular chaperone Hsp33
MKSPHLEGTEDVVRPWQVDALDLRGRAVRLGPMVDHILTRHDYPVPVAKLLGEAVVLATLLGTALKFEGRFILQTQTDGPVSMLVVDFMAPDGVRAVARVDRDRLAVHLADGRISSADLLGAGTLAMTIDQGSATSRYQGLVALDHGTLEDAAHRYFAQSEQIPTKVRFAVAQDMVAGEGGLIRRWRAGGLLAQFLPKAQNRAIRDISPGDAPPGALPVDVPDDDAWIEGQALVATIEDVELVDPAVSTERLLYRLFNQPGVRVFEGQSVTARCSCSREKVEAMLANFSQDDRDHMVENGRIAVTCEFCNETYGFDPSAFATAATGTRTD